MASRVEPTKQNSTTNNRKKYRNGASERGDFYRKTSALLLQHCWREVLEFSLKYSSEMTFKSIEFFPIDGALWIQNFSSHTNFISISNGIFNEIE